MKNKKIYTKMKKEQIKNEKFRHLMIDLMIIMKKRTNQNKKFRHLV